MSWLEEMSLRDVDDGTVIEATCIGCGNAQLLSPVEILLRVDHRNVRLDEVASNSACKRKGCRHVGARLALLGGETSGFVGGMP